MVRQEPDRTDDAGAGIRDRAPAALTFHAVPHRRAVARVYDGNPPAKSIALTEYPQGDLKYQMDSGSEFAEKVALDFLDMHLLQDLISGIRTRRKEGGVDEKATTDVEVDVLGTGRKIVEENKSSSSA